ncbi:unnamed protein product, partial [Rotaria sp. Silwood2]
NSIAFIFDHVFLPEFNQDLYRECIYDKIQGYFQGYIAFILVYGQNGSRKTFIIGSKLEYMDPSKEGIIPRTIMHLFQRYRSNECETESIEISLPKCIVSCQFIETLDCLKEGALNRTTASTLMNSVSSRSHTIFTVNLQFERAIQSVSTPNPNLWEQLHAKIHFADLTGSESLQ